MCIRGLGRGLGFLLRRGGGGGGAEGSWDTTTASFVQSHSIATEEASPYGVTFKDDGSKMYVIGINSDSIHEYNLSTAWDLSSVSFVQSQSVVAQASTPVSVVFNSDGTKVYVSDASGNIHEYNVGTAWDISTISHVQSQALSGGWGGISFKPDGTRLYVFEGTEDVGEYTLSTPWDISTASLTQTQDISGDVSGINAGFFKPDGTHFYVVDDSDDIVHDFVLSVEWDVSTASLNVSTFSVGAQDNSPLDIAFGDNGNKMYITGSQNDSVYEYNLT